MTPAKRSALSCLLDAWYALEEPLREFVRAAAGSAEALGTDRAIGIIRSLSDAAGVLPQCRELLQRELEARESGT
jgi:hypothetical protein